VRIKNLMLGGKEGGFTLYKGQEMPLYDAAMRYIADGTPTVVFGGEEYGTGSSRDWAAKGTQLLGVKAVIARSFERIHRSNLVGMGVLPLQFTGTDSAQSLGLKVRETIVVVQPGEIVGQDLDVLLRERVRGRGHVAVDVGPRARLEAPELREQIVRLLSRQARNVLLPQQLASVALHAVELMRERRSRGGALR